MVLNVVGSNPTGHPKKRKSKDFLFWYPVVYEPTRIPLGTPKKEVRLPFCIVGSATLRRPDLPWFSNNFAIDIFMPVILAEKTANSFATITVFRDLPSFFTVFGNSCKKYPRFFCKDSKCIRDFPTNNFCHDHQPKMSIIPGLKPLRFRHNRRTPMGKTRPLFPFKQVNTSI